MMKRTLTRVVAALAIATGTLAAMAPAQAQTSSYTQTRYPVVLVHGMLDDNVHPENTLELVHELQSAERQFEVMLYPTARHPIVNSHYSRLTYDFILRAMGRAEQTKENSDQ